MGTWRRCRGEGLPRETVTTTVANAAKAAIHFRVLITWRKCKGVRKGQDQKEASLAPNRNAAERRNREADPRARSAENRGADRDVAPLRGPSQNAAAASPDAAPHPREGRGPSQNAAAASPDAAPSSANARRCKGARQEIGN